MILIFGGTTEGKAVAKLLDFMKEPYFYSTKNKTNVEINGTLISRTMNADEIEQFCIENTINLIIDAAHPFAVQLHENICNAASIQDITTIRYERNFPNLQNEKNVRMFSSFTELTDALQQSNYNTILALTGVQTIPHYANISEDKKLYYRILNTKLSKEKADSFGVEKQYLVPSSTDFNTDELIKLAESIHAEVLTSKESGESGYFLQKLEASGQLNIPLWVVQRPELPAYTDYVNSEKQLLQQLYKLKKNIKKPGTELRSGYTTGTCVTAAAKACFITLVEGKFPYSVNVTLPDNEEASFLIFPEKQEKNSAACVVIKDAGDDPDVTHAKEIGCELFISDKPGIRFLQGKGIGKITIPGLQLPVGEPAINPVPRKMITSMLETLSEEYELECGFDVTPFVPEGEVLAKQTFNPRVGVVGGISIIGTSGKVIPYSNDAFLATVKYQLNIVKENDLNEIVLTSGKRSEDILSPLFSYLPGTAFIHYGNLIGDTIKAAANAGIKKINMGIMLGKAMKLAEGNLNTHSKEVIFNADFAAEIAEECGYNKNIIKQIKQLKLANGIRDLIPFSEDEPFYKEIAIRSRNICVNLCNSNVNFTLFLYTDNQVIIKG